MNLAFSDINYWAVILGAIATMVTGSIWYSPSTPMGKKWMALSGHTEGGDTSNMGMLYGLMFLSSLVMSFFFAVIIKTLGITTYHTALMVGFWIWVGFIGASSAGQYLFPPKPAALYAMDTIYKLINVLIIVLILIAWK